MRYKPDSSLTFQDGTGSTPSEQRRRRHTSTGKEYIKKLHIVDSIHLFTFLVWIYNKSQKSR